jgi:hypothetical protein
MKVPGLNTEHIGDYRIAGKFGEDFNLAVWQSATMLPNLFLAKLTSANVCYDVTLVERIKCKQ